ncbi:sepiapterin reductase [Ceratitis capitata]|uniref:sepiapterin reductase n=1 Tax=Ceratitis capitata TaxID=7213 RepID=UPI000329C1D7|nr:sepiapterin reductase [Ceratitis capitata]
MTSLRQDLSKRTFFVLSGVTNVLSKPLAIEICRNLSSGSVVVLIDLHEESMQEIKKEIELLERDVKVFCTPIQTWKDTNRTRFQQILNAILNKYNSSGCNFELAFILHNEGTMATDDLMEPSATDEWLSYVEQHLHAPVALNRAFLHAPQFSKITKLVVNITSSLMIRPSVYNTMMCSCLSARDMYFRAMANKEHGSGVNVLSYSPGILKTHKPQRDSNQNVIDLLHLDVERRLLGLPRVGLKETSLKLINILRETSFISGQDVDYYDTFFI